MGITHHTRALSPHTHTTSPQSGYSTAASELDWQDPEQRISITGMYTGVERGEDGAIVSAKAIMYAYLLNDYEGTVPRGGSPQMMLEEEWVSGWR